MSRHRRIISGTGLETDDEPYLVVIEGDSDSGYSAYLPELPGCVTVGDSIEETKALMQEAVEFNLDGLREDMGVASVNQPHIRPTLRFELAQTPQTVRDNAAEYTAEETRDS